MRTILLAAAILAGCSGSDGDVYDSFSEKPSVTCAPAWTPIANDPSFTGQCAKSCMVPPQPSSTSCIVKGLSIDGNTGKPEDVQCSDLGDGYVTADGRGCCLIWNDGNDPVTESVYMADCK